MKRILSAIAILNITIPSLYADMTFRDSFDGATLNPIWNNNLVQATLDTSTHHVVWDLRSGWKSFGNVNGPLNSNQGYVSFVIGTIDNHPVQTTFQLGVGSIMDAKQAILRLPIQHAGTYEIFYNNSPENNVFFDNGNGWTGTLAPEQARIRIDGKEEPLLATGTAQSRIHGSKTERYAAADSFGWALNIESTFTIDDVVISDVIIATPPPAMLGLLGLGFPALLLLLRKK